MQAVSWGLRLLGDEEYPFCEIPYDEPQLLYELEMVSNLQISSRLREFFVECCSFNINCLPKIWITSKKGGYEDNCEVEFTLPFYGLVS